MSKVRIEPCEQSRFSFRTLTEARLLAAKLGQFCPDAMQTEIGLTELMINAVEHGNLGISYDEKTQLLTAGCWEDEIAARLALPENAAKEVTVSMTRASKEIRFLIRDQGQGFDCQNYLNIDPTRVLHIHGRGIAWANILSFDRLEYRGNGNEVLGVVRLDKKAD